MPCKIREEERGDDKVQSPEVELTGHLALPICCSWPHFGLEQPQPEMRVAD